MCWLTGMRFLDPSLTTTLYSKVLVLMFQMKEQKRGEDRWLVWVVAGEWPDLRVGTLHYCALAHFGTEEGLTMPSWFRRTQKTWFFHHHWVVASAITSPLPLLSIKQGHLLNWIRLFFKCELLIIGYPISVQLEIAIVLGMLGCASWKPTTCPELQRYPKWMLPHGKQNVILSHVYKSISSCCTKLHIAKESSKVQKCWKHQGFFYLHS